MVKQVHAVGVILENERGQVLVLRRHPSTPEGTTWGLVGGKVNAGEEIAQTAIRKTNAETGITLDPSQLSFVKTYHWDREDLDIMFEVFWLKVVSDVVSIRIDPVGSTEYKWSDPQDLRGQADLMIGLYPILDDVYKCGVSRP